MSNKIALIVGVRPEFIQSTPLFRELEKYYDDVFIIHTGQHYDYEMSKIFFEDLKLPKPRYYLSVGSATPGEQTGEMLKRIERVLLDETPNLVVVFGDTNTTLAGALAATKLHIPVAHVESGMRSFDKSMPEEINRIIVDHISDILFVPTRSGIKNLKKEGINENVYLTGDITVEALLKNLKVAEVKSKILEQLNVTRKGYIIVTVHREKNTTSYERLKSITNALVRISEVNDLDVIFPIHPRTKKYLIQYKLWEKLRDSKVRVISPLGYLDFIKLLKYSAKILTDSGGIQKEAYILKVPCITLRDVTEWVETVETGWNILVGTKEDKIVEAALGFDPTSRPHPPIFGKGNASKNMANIIRDFLRGD